MDSDQSKVKQPAEQIQRAAHQVARNETASRPVRRYRSILFQIYLLASLAGFTALAILASTSAYLPIDLQVTKTLQLLRQPPIPAIMVAVSYPGYTIQALIMVALVVLAIYLFGLQWEAMLTLIMVVAEEALNFIIKTAIHRPRPTADLVQIITQTRSYSFPSGHVMFYTAFFGFIFYLAFTLLKPSVTRTLILIPTGLMVALVGLSRIYVGDHWASDVLGGYLLGSLVLIATVMIYHWGKPRFFARQPVAPEPLKK